jgi:hypothetical protein
MTVQTYIGQLVVQTCCNCGVHFGIDSEHNAELLRTKEWFYCPNGHSQHYLGESDKQRAERLARDLAAAHDREDTLRAESQKRYRLQRAAEGKTRAMKRRVAAGVCPCCTRTFQNLARHMKTEHPGFPQDAE